MFSSAVSIPLSLGLAGFSAGMATATSGIGVLARSIGGVALASARAFTPIGLSVVPVLKSIGTGVVSAFSASNLLKVRAVNDAIQQFGSIAILTAASLQNFTVLSPFVAVLNPTFLQLSITASGLDAAIVTLIARSIVGFKNLASSAKVNVAGLALGAFLALSATIPLVTTQMRTISQVFITGLIPNVQTLNALMLAKSSFFKGNLLQPIRYTDWVVLAGIVKNLLPTSSLLGQTLNSLAVPAKFLQNIQKTRALFTLMKQEIAFLVTELNGLSTGLAQSAGSLLQGGGFLLPGQLPQGPTVFDMFDKQQAVEQAVGFEQLTGNLEAVAKWTGVSESAINEMRREILQLTGATGQSTDFLAAMAGTLQRSGQPIEEVSNQLKTFAFAATATNSNIQLLGSTVLDVLDSFGLGADQTTRVTDMLTAVSLKTGASVEQLGASLEVVGVTAQQSNQSLESTLAIIGLISGAGLEGRVGGNALITFMKDLELASSDMNKVDFASTTADLSQLSGKGLNFSRADNKGKALAAIGLSKDDISTAQGDLKPLTDILPVLQAKVSAFKATVGAGATTTVLDAVFGAEGSKIVNSLLSQSTGQLDTLTSAVSNYSGVSQQIASSQMGGLVGTLEKLNGAVIGISTTLGLMLAPILNTLISPLANLADGFLKLPSAIQAVAFSLSVLVPISLFYLQATKTVLYWNKFVAVSKVALAVATDIYTGRLALSTIITNIHNGILQVQSYLTKGMAFVTDVLTGRITLQVAQQTILNRLTKFGNANYKEYITTTLRAGQIFLKQVATLGLMILAWQALSELFKKSEGAKIAGDIDKATQEFTKFRSGLEQQKESLSLIDELRESFGKFAEDVQNKGFAEATRLQLLLVQDALLGTKIALDTYGEDWKFASAEQVGNQKSMFALDSQLQAVHTTLDAGTSIMQKYGVETLDAADRQRLGVSGVAAFKSAAEEQIKVLNAGVEAMRKQAPATEEQKVLQQENIKLSERQINTLRTKIQALESDTFAEQINNKAMRAKILTLDEITQKYKDVAHASELANLKATASIEEAAAKGKGSGGISQEEKTKRLSVLSKTEINERVQSNDNKLKDLRAASIGATTEDATKIAEEIEKIEIDQVKARIDSAKYEQQGRKTLNDDLLASNKELEDSVTAKQQLSSQNQITAIRKAQAARTYSAEEAAAKIGAIETADLQASIARETEKQRKLNQFRQWGVISEEEARRGIGESAIAIAKTQGQLAEAEIKKSEERVAARVKAIQEQAKFSKLKPEQELAKLDAQSFAGDQQGKIATAQSGVGDARSELDKQRLGFALQLAELNSSQSQQEQVKNQIYQQQLVSLTQQQQAKRQELVISQQQAAIELERKRVQSEIAVLEAQSALKVAQAQGASAGEIAALQQSIALKQQIVAQVATEKTNQQKLNSLSAEQLAIQQQTAKEGIEQQRQIDLQRQAIEKKTKAIEEGINRARALSETQLQGLDFKGQDIGAEISKQKLLTDISQSQSSLQKQRLEFSLESAELADNESNKEQIKQQIYQQQLTSLATQHQAQRTSLELSNQQVAIELERKRIQGEISLLEAQANLQTAEVKNASAAEVESLQSIIDLRQKSLDYISTEEANQSKVNQLTNQHLTIEQQIAKEALEQQHQIELERQAIERKTKAIEDGLTKAKNLSEAQSQKLEFKGQDIGAEISRQKLLTDISQSQSNLQKQRLEFSLQSAELTGDEANKEQIKQQIYQQQLTSMAAQHQAQRTSLELSNEQAKIELERKRIQNEIALIEAQASLASAQTKHLSDEEIDSLQAVISLREKSIAYIATEEANQSKINQLAGQHLVVEQQIAKEGLEQQRQIDLQRQAIEKKTKAIEDGLTKAKNLSEAQSQKLEFKGQDIGSEISKQKLLADISQSQASLQKQRLEFSLQTAELAGNEANKEQIRQQIYQQQQSSLVAQHQAQRISLELSIQQAKIELERKRIQNEIALIEAQANLASAQAKNLSDVEIDSLQAVVSLREKSIAYIATEEANQSKINQLTSQHLSIEQQIAREGLEQQRQLEMQKLAIEKRTKAIEDGLIRARTAMEGKSQNLEFEGQTVGGEIGKQKSVTDLQQSQSALQKQQLDFALQRAELTGNESAKEQIKEQIYQQQKEALIAQQQAQIVGIGLSRQQAAIELERQKLSAQIALTEAQANVAKAQVTKTTSAAEMEALQAAIGYRQQSLSQITAQAAVSKQVQSTEEQKLAIERQTTMENMVQTRELERQREAIEKQKKAIEERLQVQKSGLENRQGKLELSSQLLDLESRQLSARSGLTEAVNGLEQQRLEFLMSQTEITGNTTQKESLKTQLYQQQLVALSRSQQAQQQSFEISQKQKQIELDKQEIQAKIATFEAEANIAKAKADNGSAQQISALEAVYKLRQDGLNQVSKMRTAEGQIANLERQKLGYEQMSAREKLRQTNQLEKMRQVYEANNKAIEKTNSLEKERSQQSSDTSGGLSWVDKAGPAWFENAKNSFQKAADDYLATPVSPDLTPITPDKPKSDLLAQQGKTPDTPQQLANMQIAAQNVYLTGTIAENKPAIDGVNAGAVPPIPATAVDANAQREVAKAKIEQAQTALSEAIARANAQKPNIDAQEATRQGAAAGQAAREYAAQIRADLKSGVLKNEVTGKTVALNLPPSLAELAANLTKAQAALKEIKDPVTMESIYKLMGEIKTILTNQSIGNLTVVSQNPVAECGEILSALTKRR